MYYAVAEQSKGGKAAVGGTCPPVGAGATLGGGLGFLSRQHGMACDSVVSARLVRRCMGGLGALQLWTDRLAVASSAQS